MIGKSKIRLTLIFLVCLPVCILLMAVWHEVAGTYNLGTHNCVHEVISVGLWHLLI